MEENWHTTPGDRDLVHRRRDFSCLLAGHPGCTMVDSYHQSDSFPVARIANTSHFQVYSHQDITAIINQFREEKVSS